MPRMHARCGHPAEYVQRATGSRGSLFISVHHWEQGAEVLIHVQKVVGEVGEGNRKDIRNAVEAAHKAAPAWGKRAAYNRSQILFYIAENLDARFEEFASRIAAMTGEGIEAGRKVCCSRLRSLRGIRVHTTD